MSIIAASIITIGDELLIGQTIDTNSAWIAKQLNKQGIDVLRRVAVGDEKHAITQALDDELSRASLVILTGGLGPTADDITKPLLLEYFGGKMRVDERTLNHVTNIFKKRSRPILERNMKQADVPDTCTVLFNGMGTAPGMWFEKDNKVIISMPGVPFEMIHIMEEEVLPKLKTHFTSEAIIHKTIFTAGEGESTIAERIKDLEEALPDDISLAYLPGAGIVKLRLTGKGGEAKQLTDRIELLQMQFANRLSDIVIATEDIPMEQVLLNWFTANNATLGLAESCTGGNIAHHLTQIPGASSYLMGGIVCYTDKVKHQLLGVKDTTLTTHGVISEAAAIELAEGAIETLNVDYSLSVTGLLGPASEDDPEENGTVWMAVSGKGKTISKKFRFHYDRIRNKEIATSLGMLMIYKFVTGGEI